MKLVSNYSSELIELIQEKTIEVDNIKLGIHDIYKEGYEVSKQHGDVLLHGLALNEHPSMTGLEEIDWNRITNLIEEFNSPHIGIHLNSFYDDWNNNEVSKNEVVERNIIGAKHWKDRIHVPFMLENTPYSKFYSEKGIIECVSDPIVITKICYEADVYLLLDIAHAKVTAYHRGESIENYLCQLPLERVKEVHVVGTMMTEEHGIRDRHIEMQDEDYKILRWILKRINVDYITLEYGGPGGHFEWRSDKQALYRQLKKIKDIISD